MVIVHQTANYIYHLFLSKYSYLVTLVAEPAPTRADHIVPYLSVDLVVGNDQRGVQLPQMVRI